MRNQTMLFWGAALAAAMVFQAGCASTKWGTVDPNISLKEQDTHVAFTLSDTDGVAVSSEARLNSGPLVVVFYPGESSSFVPLESAIQLGELSHELDAFTARGVSLVGISTDSRGDSRALAARLKLRFPLLEDGDGAVTRAYAGLEGDGGAISAVFLIGEDGVILFAKYAVWGADRVDARELLAVIDRARPSDSAKPGVRGGYRPSERSQLQVTAGASVGFGGWDGHNWGAMTVDLTRLTPVGTSLMIGESVRGVFGKFPLLEVGTAVKLRHTFRDGLEEIYLTSLVGASIGLSSDVAVGLHVGARLGSQAVILPSLAFTVQFGFIYEGFIDSAMDGGFRVTAEMGLTWF